MVIPSQTIVFGSLLLLFTVTIISPLFVQKDSNTTTPSNRFPTLLQCNPETEHKRLKKVKTNCPSSREWMEKFSVSEPKSLKTIIVVGCNKGDDAANMFGLFDYSNDSFNPQNWIDALSEKKSTRGACGIVRVSPAYKAKVEFQKHLTVVADRPPLLYCIEPMPNNVKLLQYAQNYSRIHETRFVILPMAMSSTKQAYQHPFPKAKRGNEVMGLHSSTEGKRRDKVTVFSIDALFQNFQTVDILLIDTEGFDPAALHGAQETLRRTRYLEFEVHRDLRGTPWQNTSLELVISYLNSYDMDCFWIGKKGELIQITNCWHGSYENRAFGWENVACVKQGDPWHSILRDIHIWQVSHAQNRTKKNE